MQQQTAAMRWLNLPNVYVVQNKQACRHTVYLLALHGPRWQPCSCSPSVPLCTGRWRRPTAARRPSPRWPSGGHQGSSARNAPSPQGPNQGTRIRITHHHIDALVHWNRHVSTGRFRPYTMSSTNAAASCSRERIVTVCQPTGMVGVHAATRSPLTTSHRCMPP